MKVNITKSYGRVVSRNYQTWRFETSVSDDYEIKDPAHKDEEIMKESAKQFALVRTLTESDIAKLVDEILEEKK